jgi:hypothetical protein
MSRMAIDAWEETRPRFDRDYQHDAGNATAYLLHGADLLGRLPAKPERSEREQHDAEHGRQRPRADVVDLRRARDPLDPELEQQREDGDGHERDRDERERRGRVEADAARQRHVVTDRDDGEREQHRQDQRLAPIRRRRDQQVRRDERQRCACVQGQTNALTRRKPKAYYSRHSVIHISWSLGAPSRFLKNP